MILLRRWCFPVTVSLLVHGLLLWLLSGPGPMGSTPQARVLQIVLQAGPDTPGGSTSAPASSPVPEPDKLVPARPVSRSTAAGTEPGTAPPGARQVEARVSADPVQAGGGDSLAGEADHHWQVRLQRYLQGFLEYPQAARLRRQEGVVGLSFEIDRQGRVLALELEQSSGFALLDQEALALVARAEPLPEPPAVMAGERWRFQVPIRFRLRQ